LTPSPANASSSWRTRGLRPSAIASQRSCPSHRQTHARTGAESPAHPVQRFCGPAMTLPTPADERAIPPDPRPTTARRLRARVSTTQKLADRFTAAQQAPEAEPARRESEPLHLLPLAAARPRSLPRACPSCCHPAAVSLNRRPRPSGARPRPAAWWIPGGPAPGLAVTGRRAPRPQHCPLRRPQPSSHSRRISDAAFGQPSCPAPHGAPTGANQRCIPVSAASPTTLRGEGLPVRRPPPPPLRARVQRQGRWSGPFADVHARGSMPTCRNPTQPGQADLTVTSKAS